MASAQDVSNHRIVTDAVHAADGKICMQILHTGRYAFNPDAVAPSAVKSPISPFLPRALTDEKIEQQIQDFVQCALLAKDAGYDGVEIMGSEGYLINQFIALRTNQREDRWGGDYQNRIRFPKEVVRRVREAAGPDFIIIYRLSMLDLVEGGSSLDEVITLGKAVELAGATLINTCIGCNQACLDHIFAGKLTSCLVNPMACHETELLIKPARQIKRIAVVGAGPAGMAFATIAAGCGHMVTLFEAAGEIGGQFNIAKRIPGKEESHETIRYYSRQIELTGVKLKLNKTVTGEMLGRGRGG